MLVYFLLIMIYFEICELLVICYCFLVIENYYLLFILIVDLYFFVVKERCVILLLVICIFYIIEKVCGYKINLKKFDNLFVYCIFYSYG